MHHPDSQKNTCFGRIGDGLRGLHQRGKITTPGTGLQGCSTGSKYTDTNIHAHDLLLLHMTLAHSTLPEGMLCPAGPAWELPWCLATRRRTPPLVRGKGANFRSGRTSRGAQKEVQPITTMLCSPPCMDTSLLSPIHSHPHPHHRSPYPVGRAGASAGCTTPQGGPLEQCRRQLQPPQRC